MLRIINVSSRVSRRKTYPHTKNFGEASKTRSVRNVAKELTLR